MTNESISSIEDSRAQLGGLAGNWQHKGKIDVPLLSAQMRSITFGLVCVSHYSAFRCVYSVPPASWLTD